MEDLGEKPVPEQPVPDQPVPERPVPEQPVPDQPDNARAVRAATAGGDLGQLEIFMAAGPRGRLRERCAFLETLSVYVDRCEAELAYSDDVLVGARQWIAARAEDLLADERSPTSRQRVEAIIDRARAHA